MCGESRQGKAGAGFTAKHQIVSGHRSLTVAARKDVTSRDRKGAVSVGRYRVAMVRKKLKSSFS